MPNAHNTFFKVKCFISDPKMQLISLIWSKENHASVSIFKLETLLLTEITTNNYKLILNFKCNDLQSKNISQNISTLLECWVLKDLKLSPIQKNPLELKLDFVELLVRHLWKVHFMITVGLLASVYKSLRAFKKWRHFRVKEVWTCAH